MNIERLLEPNFGGAVTAILYVRLKDVLTFPIRSGINIESEIILKPGKSWNKIEFTALEYEELRKPSGGGYKYMQELSGIIAKDRPEITQIFEQNNLSQFIVLYTDKNSITRIIGNPKEPARFDVPKKQHRKFMERNGYEVIVFCDTREPAPSYLAELPEYSEGGFNPVPPPQTGTAVKEKRHAWLSPYSYCGVAPSGSLETTNTWKITRITVAADGSTTTATASNVAWTNRLTVTYI
jgi:hypothetical protein